MTDEGRRQLARDAVFAGEPLWQQGFWNVLARVMSGEAFQLSVDAGGYESTLSNCNAADAIPWFLADFGVSPLYDGFKKGFQQVPSTLAALVGKASGRIVTNRALQSFDRDAGDGVFGLRFRDGTAARAKAVVLAMPRRALELIDSPLLSAISPLIKSVTPRPLFKLFTTYASPWWLSAGVEAGRTVTDLPVRQTYYWPQNDGKPATAGRAMLRVSYDDGSTHQLLGRAPTTAGSGLAAGRR